MCCELKITVANDEKKLSFKHLLYEPIQASTDDPTIKALINDAVKEFNDTPETVKIKIALEV